MARKHALNDKPGVYRVTPVKKGRRLYGGIVIFEDGRRCYIAYRHLDEIFRHGCFSIAEALTKGKAAWAFDIDTVLEMRAKGVKLMGVKVIETGDIYLTHTDILSDSTKAKVLNYERRGGALQRYLPLSFFWKRQGAIVVKPS